MSERIPLDLVVFNHAFGPVPASGNQQRIAAAQVVRRQHHVHTRVQQQAHGGQTDGAVEKARAAAGKIDYNPFAPGGEQNEDVALGQVQGFLQVGELGVWLFAS